MFHLYRNPLIDLDSKLVQWLSCESKIDFNKLTYIYLELPRTLYFQLR